MTPQQFVAKWSRIEQKETAVLDWFNGPDGFREAHRTDANEWLIYHLIDDD